MARKVSQSSRKSQQMDQRTLAQINEIYGLYQKQRFVDAQTRIARVLSKSPRSVHAHTLAAMIASSLDQDDRALYHAQTAVSIDPANTDALCTLGGICALDGKHEEAAKHYAKAYELQPDHPGAIGGLGTAYGELGRFGEARPLLKRAAELNPNLPDPIINRALFELETAHAREAISIAESAPGPLKNHPGLVSLKALASSYDDALSPMEVFEAHRAYGVNVEQHIPPAASFGNVKDPDRKIRVGYVSGDLRQHSIAYFLEPILEHLDRDRFETHLFSTSAHRDRVTDRLEESAHAFHLCNEMSLPELSKFIHDQQIDVLVELCGHFAGHKLPVFASRPAPVQITHIGYGNTTGLTRIDARFVDEVTDPSGSSMNADALATEQLVRLDGCFLCYRPNPDLPEISVDTDRGVTIGSFNNLKKLSASTVRVWSQILEQRPGAKLLLKSAKLANDEMRHELIERFNAHGVGEERLDLRGFSPTPEEHLGIYNELDVSLDTFPYTGTTTTCESLSMGVPMVTLMGAAHAGRVSSSILKAVGLDEDVHDTEEAYIARVVELIDQGVRSMEDRVGTRDRLLNSSMCDGIGYAKKIEGAYRALWRSWCGV